MKIGILGTGDVGTSLGTAFITLGHEVMMGARSAANEKARAWAKQAGPAACHGTFADAARWGEMIVLATLGSANDAALTSAGPDQFAGKIVLDTTNPLEFPPSAPPRLFVGHTDSGGERVQRKIPAAHVVKVFNTIGHLHMFRPSFPGGPPDMFICGNHDGAKATVAALLADFGWGVVDIGGIEGSRYLEPLCMVWVLHAVRTGTWNHAYKFLRK